MTNQQTTPNFAEIARRARRMDAGSLAWSRRDARDAAAMADALEAAGCAVLKTGGYYRDEAGVYAAEQRRRAAARA